MLCPDCPPDQVTPPAVCLNCSRPQCLEDLPNPQTRGRVPLMRRLRPYILQTIRAQRAQGATLEALATRYQMGANTIRRMVADLPRCHAGRKNK